jgi:UDP-glucuronate 4-epimerase
MTINLGSDEPVVLLDAIRLVERLTGQTATIESRPAHPADVTATWADVSRAGQTLGWEPQVSFEAGVKSLVAWYQAERAWASQIETGL